MLDTATEDEGGWYVRQTLRWGSRPANNPKLDNLKNHLIFLVILFPPIQVLAMSFRSEINPLPRQQCNFIAFTLAKNSRFISISDKTAETPKTLDLHFRKPPSFFKFWKNWAWMSCKLSKNWQNMDWHKLWSSCPLTRCQIQIQFQKNYNCTISQQ